jgi:protein-disulfide isomerase
MSRKTSRNQPNTAPPVQEARRFGRTSFLIVAVVALLLAVVAGILLYKREPAPTAVSGGGAEQSALASAHSPMLGDASAKVHVVEFLDPACETCATFFPLVKQVMAENPGKIHLSVRHVAFHNGSDYVVRLLEASRKQDRYWQTLEALLTSQHQWAPDHTVQPDRVGPVIAGVGLDMEQLMADMNSPEVAQRVEQDRNDAIVMKVTATPEYFVNGRPLPSFGEQQLLDLLGEELRSAY